MEESLYNNSTRASEEIKEHIIEDHINLPTTVRSNFHGSYIR